MSKQVLSVEQMLHLQELGLELKPTMLYYFHWNLLPENQWDLYLPLDNIEEYNTYYEFIPAYTLQDILDKLPKIIIDDHGYYLAFGVTNENNWHVAYYGIEESVRYYAYNKEFIDAAYEILCCCIEGKYVKTNKNE